MQMIQAAVARRPHAHFSIEKLTLEAPRADEVLVKVIATGVCHTDIAMRDQTYPVPQPIVLGHEGAGVVVAIGSGVTKVEVGDHVVMSFNFCGQCGSCIEHQPQYCHDYFTHNFAGNRADSTTALANGSERIHSHFFGQSSFATFALCRERNAIKVRRDVSLELLGPLACGVQTGAGAVIHSLKVGVGRSLAVFGAGSVGLSAVMAARVVGATTIIAVDINDDRLSLALELGATHVINALREDVAAVVKGITGNGVNFALDTTGRPQTIRTAVDSLAPRGICGLVGASPVGTEIAIDAMNIMTAGRQIRGIVEGDATPDVFIPELIELYRQGRFPFDRLIKFYPFSEINTAIEDAEQGKTVKPVVRMTEQASPGN